MTSISNELLKAGHLGDALEALKSQVRSEPAAVEHRVFLFQILAVLGSWKRAADQLDVVEGLDKKTWPMVHAYRDAINAELHREAVFSGLSKPLVFGEPSEWMALLVEAQQMLAKGNSAAFADLNGRAFELAPARGGRVNDEEFAWLADADQRFGPVLEMIFNGHYYWVPLDAVSSLRTEEPSDLRDLVWLPAEVTWINGGQNMVLVPARYPLLSGASDACLLARKTEWQKADEDLYEGVGQRMLTTDQSDYPLLQVRSLEFGD